VCLLLFVLLVVLANPLHNFPMGDDWEYARTAQRLLTTGQFYRSPVVQATALFSGVWGALFSAALGFSFTTLRLSTLPLAAGAVALFCLILGELGFDAPRQLLGGLTLLVAPLFVFNALSFMTDVPFLFWLLAGWWCALRAFRQGRLAWLVAGSACSALAFLTRQLGLALPAAVALAVLPYRPRSDWSRWLAACLAVPIAAAAAFFVWQALTQQTTWADSTITGQGTLQFIFNVQLPAALGRRIVLMFISVNLYLAPLWLAFWPGWRQAWQALRRLGRGLRLTALGLVVFFFGSAAFFGERGDWWPYTRGSLTNAGLWPTLAYFAFPNDVRPPFLPEPFWIGMTFVGAALAVALALNLVARVAGMPHPPGPPFLTQKQRQKRGERALAHAAGSSLPTQGERQENGEQARSHPAGTPFPTKGKCQVRAELTHAWQWLLAGVQALGPARGLSYAVLLSLLALVMVYPLFVERYYLPLLPGAIILLLEATRRLPFSPLTAGAGLLLVGALSVGLMWDYFDWHAARWTNSQALVAAGVPLEKLDAGYEWNGWYLSDEAYAYIQAHHAPLVDDPFEYVLDPEYMVTFTPQPGYQVAQQWPFYSPFRLGGADHLLLLKRAAAQ